MKELVLIGGHPAEEGEIHRYLASKAKTEGEIGYVAFAADVPAEATAEMERKYSQYEIKVRAVKEVDDCYGLSVVYLGGGDQERLVRRLKQAQMDGLLRTHWKRGNVVLAGSSAGAMAMFSRMLPGETIDERQLELVDGMGPMGGAFVLPHADRISDEYKQKLAAAHPDLGIIMIEEDTALVWRNGECEVLGAGQVELAGRSRGSFGAGDKFTMMSTG
ncbi:MAG TPA: Type 1 glutamine amidotransferase-like domain-containing protein [Candidatus Saccharimonadales bacterium]|nr:Type 1 glutamine amidotransferase-like domain-containing protein [Candidatus Saccharimonadales bacterium]